MINSRRGIYGLMECQEEPPMKIMLNITAVIFFPNLLLKPSYISKELFALDNKSSFKGV